MISCLRLPAFVICLLPAALCAESVVMEGTGSDDGIAETIRARDEQLADPAKPRSVEQRKARRTEWMERVGLDASVTFDSLALGALASDAGWGTSSGDATLNVRWQIAKDISPTPFSLNVRARHREACSDLAPSELRRETGALWGYVDGFTDAGFEVPECYFENKLFDKRLTVRLGQMAIDDLLDNHRLRSAKRSFLNQAFSSSPAVGFPGSGMGLVTRWEGDGGWDFTLAISNLESSNRDDASKWRLRSDALFEAVQIGHRFNGIAGKPARIQLLLWNADELPEAGLASGSGASLTLEQKWGERGRAFLRYAWSDGEAAAASHFAMAGAAVDLRRSDRLGASLGGGTPSAADAGWEGVVEIFYRRQINSALQVTPDLQFAFGDHVGGDSDWLAIAGVRMSFTF